MMETARKCGACAGPDVGLAQRRLVVGDLARRPVPALRRRVGDPVGRAGHGRGPPVRSRAAHDEWNVSPAAAFVNSSVFSGKRSVPSLVPYGAPAENMYLVFSGLTAGALLSSVGIVGRPARGNAACSPAAYAAVLRWLIQHRV